MSEQKYVSYIEEIPSVKSEYVSIINGYSVSPFNERLKDVCCIMRIIEINKLNKLRK